AERTRGFQVLELSHYPLGHCLMHTGQRLLELFAVPVLPRAQETGVVGQRDRLRNNGRPCRRSHWLRSLADRRSRSRRAARCGSRGRLRETATLAPACRSRFLDDPKRERPGDVLAGHVAGVADTAEQIFRLLAVARRVQRTATLGLVDLFEATAGRAGPWP